MAHVAHDGDNCIRLVCTHLFVFFNRLFESPVCGNGFTEEGEECDCGIADSDSCLKNTCCNPSTCTLYPNATCGAGTCCDLSVGVCFFVSVVSSCKN